MRSPTLTRDEWILLLELYLSRKPHSVTIHDPDLLSLSALFSRRHGPKSEAAQSWRSPDGLRARMSVFRVLDPSINTPDTKRARLGEQVWREYSNAPEALKAAAAAARASILASSDSSPDRSEGDPQGRSPRLDEDEWILLLNLFISAGRKTLPLTDPRLHQLSAVMRRRRGYVGPTPTWRSPDGLRRELSVLRSLNLGRRKGEAKSAKAAEHVWRIFADDPTALAAEVARIESDLSPSAQTHNPPWSEDETLLALDAYLQVRPRYAGPEDEPIQNLSRLLQLLAERTGIAGAESFRNPAGVARKVNKFRAAEAELGHTAVKGAKLESDVWAAFVKAPGPTLRRAADLTRTVLADPSSLPTDHGATSVRPSRGPVPSFGAVTHVRQDGETLVYLLELTGPVAALYPDEAREGLKIIKIGRANDLRRRISQLNAGFPPKSGLAWRCVDYVVLDTGQAADDVEQELLGRLYERDLTLGGEFALLPKDELKAFLPLVRSPAENSQLA